VHTGKTLSGKQIASLKKNAFLQKVSLSSACGERARAQKAPSRSFFFARPLSLVFSSPPPLSLTFRKSPCSGREGERGAVGAARAGGLFRQIGGKGAEYHSLEQVTLILSDTVGWAEAEDRLEHCNHAPVTTRR
jgi:hypothetical protein